MAKVYAPPKEIRVPDFDPENWQKADKEFIQKLRDYCLANGTGDLRGEVVSFPVADGAASYMVFTTKPLAFIHMPLGDAWQFQYVNRLTLADVKKQVKRRKALDELFRGPLDKVKVGGRYFLSTLGETEGAWVDAESKSDEYVTVVVVEPVGDRAAYKPGEKHEVNASNLYEKREHASREYKSKKAGA
jgi:hypothetical protein